MTFTKVNPGDPIQAHQLNQVIDALIGTSGSGVPIAVTAVNDALNYALTVQNDETGNSRALNVIKSDGTLLIRGDASGVSLGTPLNLAAGSVPGSALADAGITNAKLGPDVARENQLTNGGFEIWQRGAGPFTGSVLGADRWQTFLAGTDTLSVQRVTGGATGTMGFSAYGLFTLGTGAGASQLSQILKVTGEYATLLGLTLSLSIAVNASAANAVRVALYDSVNGWRYSSYHPGDSQWHTLTLTAPIASNATQVNAGVVLSATCNFYLDNANLVVGSQPANYVPLHPADDLARCLRYYEIVGTPSNSGQTELGLGQCYSGTSALVFLKYVQKPVVPTTTVTGTPSLNNSGGGAIPITGASGINSGVNSGGLNTIVASGLVAGNATRLTATGANQYIVLEANP